MQVLESPARPTIGLGKPSNVLPGRVAASSSPEAVMLYSSAALLLNPRGPLSTPSQPTVRRVRAGRRPWPMRPWSELAHPCASVGQTVDE